MSISISIYLSRLTDKVNRYSTCLTVFMTLVCICAYDSAPADAAPAWPLKVSPNGRYLVDQDDQPFFLMADTPWSIPQALPDEVDIYLADRQSKGFTCILVQVIPWSSSSPGRRGEWAFLDTDNAPCNPIESYFDNLKTIIQKARSLDMLVTLTPAWVASYWWYRDKPCWPDYGRYLANKFADDPNIIWIHGGDQDPWNVQREIDIMNAIHDQELNELQIIPKLQSYHPAARSDIGVGRIGSSSQWFHDAVDFNSFQSNYGCNTNAYLTINADWNLFPTKPTWNMEPAYGVEKLDEDVRMGIYWSSFSGGTMGLAYGINKIFRMGYDDLWQTQLNHVTTDQYLALGNLLRTRQWWKLQPDGGYGPEDCDHAVRTIADDSSFMLIYTPVGRTMEVDMSRFGGQVTTQWMNARTGEYTIIGTFSNTGLQSFTTPNSEDWVLVLDSAGIAPPQNLQAVANPDVTVELSWQDMSGDEEGFVIMRRPWQGIDQWHSIIELPANTTGYTDIHFLGGQVQYRYQVGAYK